VWKTISLNAKISYYKLPLSTLHFFRMGEGPGMRALSSRRSASTLYNLNFIFSEKISIMNPM
jgi:lauroyl/myristoyl acyltransferase